MTTLITELTDRQTDRQTDRHNAVYFLVQLLDKQEYKSSG